MTKLFLPLLLCIWLSSTAFAAPKEVVLFPAGGMVTEQLTFAAGTNRASFLLPEVALPETLRLELVNATDRQRITTIESMSVLPQVEPFSELQETIKQLKRQITTMGDQISARRITLAYWQQQSPATASTRQAVNLNDIQHMADLVRGEGESLLTEISELTWQQNERKAELAEAERQLQQKTSQQRRNWQITVQLAQPLTAPTEVTAQYRIRNAGWSSTYILNARPANKQVEWVWTAQINQRSGSDWNDVHIKLATAEPVFTLTPPTLPGWDIRAGAIMPMAKTLARSEVMLAAPAGDSVGAEPLREQGQLFDIYDLGRQTIASGTPAQIQIRSGNWDADFAYLTRPLQSTQAFLEARLRTEQEFTPLPTGSASIQVDGVHVGQRSFSLYQSEDIALSFGSDPGIDIAVSSAHVAGKRGLLNREKTYEWNWTLTLSNNKHLDIVLRVEDVPPHAGHKDIDIREAFQPPLPERGDDAIFWALALKAGQQQTLKYGYKISYPKEMNVILGR